MNSRRIAVGCLAALIGVPVTLLFCLIAAFYLLYEDVSDEALDRTRAVLAGFQTQPYVMEPTSRVVNALYPLYECKAFLSKKVATFGSRYTVKLLGAFDADDPKYAIKATYPPIGNREATVLVEFPDGTGTVLYWYNGDWEDCWDRPNMSTTTPTNANAN